MAATGPAKLQIKYRSVVSQQLQRKSKYVDYRQQKQQQQQIKSKALANNRSQNHYTNATTSTNQCFK
jgi:hypothetical protein